MEKPQPQQHEENQNDTNRKEEEENANDEKDEAKKSSINTTTTPNTTTTTTSSKKNKRISKKKSKSPSPKPPKSSSTTKEETKTFHTIGFGSNYFHVFGGQDALPITSEYYHHDNDDDDEDEDDGDEDNENEKETHKKQYPNAYIFQSIPPETQISLSTTSNNHHSNNSNSPNKSKKRKNKKTSALSKGSHIFTTLISKKKKDKLLLTAATSTTSTTTTPRSSLMKKKKKKKKHTTQEKEDKDSVEEACSTNSSSSSSSSTTTTNTLPLPYGTTLTTTTSSTSTSPTLPTSYTCGSTHTTTLLTSCTTTTNLSLQGTIHGTIHPNPTLVETKLPLKIIQVASGRRHVLALCEGGVVTLSWGAGHFGQLGHGGEVVGCECPKIVERLLPQMIGGRVIHIAAGGLHSAAIIDPNSSSSPYTPNSPPPTQTRTFTWGSNRRGQCGIEGGKCHTVPYPTPLVDVYHPDDSSTKVSFVKLSLGRLHSVGLTASGEVYTWGSSTMGRCGHGHSTTPSSSHDPSKPIPPQPKSRYHIYTPTRVQALRNVKSTMIAAGDGHTLVLSGSGRVFSWGCGSEGQLGQGHAMHLLSPRFVNELDFGGVVSGVLEEVNGGDGECISSFSLHSSFGSAATTTTSGGGSTASVVVARRRSRNKTAPPPKITSIYASGSYSAAISSSGDIYTWGYGDPNQLGHPFPTSDDASSLPYIEVGGGNGNNGNGGSNNSAASDFGNGKHRIRDSQSFDSRLNVLLPRRVECTRELGLRVEDAALGPSHMVLLCSVREEEEEDDDETTYDDENDDDEEEGETTDENDAENDIEVVKNKAEKRVIDPIGITLYEAELMRMAKGMHDVRAKVVPKSQKKDGKRTAVPDISGGSSPIDTDTITTLPPPSPADDQTEQKVESAQSLTPTSTKIAASTTTTPLPTATNQNSSNHVVEKNNEIISDSKLIFETSSQMEQLPQQTKQQNNDGRSPSTEKALDMTETSRKDVKEEDVVTESVATTTENVQTEKDNKDNSTRADPVPPVASSSSSPAAAETTLDTTPHTFNKKEIDTKATTPEPLVLEESPQIVSSTQENVVDTDAVAALSPNEEYTKSKEGEDEEIINTTERQGSAQDLEEEEEEEKEIDQTLEEEGPKHEKNKEITETKKESKDEEETKISVDTTPTTTTTTTTTTTAATTTSNTTQPKSPPPKNIKSTPSTQSQSSPAPPNTKSFDSKTLSSPVSSVASTSSEVVASKTSLSSSTKKGWRKVASKLNKSARKTASSLSSSKRK